MTEYLQNESYSHQFQLYCTVLVIILSSSLMGCGMKPTFCNSAVGALFIIPVLCPSDWENSSQAAPGHLKY